MLWPVCSCVQLLCDLLWHSLAGTELFVEEHIVQCLVADFVLSNSFSLPGLTLIAGVCSATAWWCLSAGLDSWHWPLQ